MRKKWYWKWIVRPSILIILIVSLLFALSGGCSGAALAVHEKGGWKAAWQSLTSKFEGFFTTKEIPSVPTVSLPDGATLEDMRLAIQSLVRANEALTNEVVTLRQKIESLPTPPSADATAQAVWGNPIETSDGHTDPFDVIRDASSSGIKEVLEELLKKEGK